MKVLPISIWSPSAQNATPFPPIRGDVGNYCFVVEGGEDSLFTNAKLAAGVVSSILRDSDLKKADALCVEEALALSLKGATSICKKTLSYLSHHCVTIIC